MNINTYQLTGLVLRLVLKPVKGDKDARSGHVVIRYGPKRKPRKNAPVQFVNAVRLRIPAASAHLFQRIKVGDIVTIVGRLQGIMNRAGKLQTELLITTCKTWSPRALGYDLVPLNGADGPPVDDGENGDPPRAPGDQRPSANGAGQGTPGVPAQDAPTTAPDDVASPEPHAA